MGRKKVNEMKQWKKIASACLSLALAVSVYPAGSFGLEEWGEEKAATEDIFEDVLSGWEDEGEEDWSFETGEGEWASQRAEEEETPLLELAPAPELTEGDRHRIHSNLYSAATSGVWLGGPRAKSLPGTPVRNGRR